MASQSAQIVRIPNPPPEGHGPPTVLFGGLMRMGSLSVAHALATLGLRTHHWLEVPWDGWKLLAEAVDATFPFANPGSVGADGQRKCKRSPFSRKEWDQLFGQFDATTDISSMFLPQLLEVYPGAKVVVVQRDFESWWRSFLKEVFEINLNSGPVLIFIFRNFMPALFGVDASSTVAKLCKGWLRADTVEGMKANARARYEEHYAWIRENIPAERVLWLNLADGWEPLCKFLGKEVPDLPFPRRNDNAEHQARIRDRMTWLFPTLRRRLLKTAVFGLVAALFLQQAVTYTPICLAWLATVVDKTSLTYR